jgi:hypothetical protein
MGLGKEILKTIGKSIKAGVKSSKIKKNPRTLAQKMNPKQVGEDLEKAVGEASKFKKRVGRNRFVAGVATAYGADKAYSAYKESPYKVKVSVEKKESPSTSNASKVTAARKEQVSANKAKVKAASQQMNAKSNKERVAANTAKVAANKKMVTANKKKVAANTARYKK